MDTANRPATNVQPISRELVLRYLQDTDGDTDYAEDTEGTICTSSRFSINYLEPDNNLSLQGVRHWLVSQCKEYEPRLDAPSDPDTTNARTVSPALSSALDTSVLERIRRGEGPRDTCFEHLLAPLRLGSVPPASAVDPQVETYKQMKDILMAWNEHVADGVTVSPKASTRAREDLITALHMRLFALNSGLSKRRSADAFEGSARRLLRAIHMSHPETADFCTQDPCELTTIILAHVGLAKPDIDDEVKDCMLRVLVKERAYMTAWRAPSINNSIAESKLEADRDALKDTDKHKDDSDPRLEAICTSVVTDIKTARRNLYLRMVPSLLSLTTLQSAQKSILKDNHLRKPLLPDPSLPMHKPHLSTVLDLPATHSDEYLDTTITDLTNLLDTTQITNKNRVLTRAAKFGGFDLRNVTRSERARIVQDRMNMPATASMMADAVAGMKETKGFVGDMMGMLDGLGRGFEEVKGELEREEEALKEWIEALGTNEGMEI